MKRKDLEAGTVVAYRRWEDSTSYVRVGVLATEAWTEGKSYYGRFGSAGNGKFRPAGHGDGRNGVAVLMERGRWLEPAVVQLSKLEPLDEAEARIEAAKAAAARQVQAEQRTRETVADLDARLEALVGEKEHLFAKNGYEVTSVRISTLSKLVELAERAVNEAGGA